MRIGFARCGTGHDVSVGSAISGEIVVLTGVFGFQGTGTLYGVKLFCSHNNVEKGIDLSLHIYRQREREKRATFQKKFSKFLHKIFVISLYHANMKTPHIPFSVMKYEASILISQAIQSNTQRFSKSYLILLPQPKVSGKYTLQRQMSSAGSNITVPIVTVRIFHCFIQIFTQTIRRIDNQKLFQMICFISVNTIYKHIM